MSYFDTRSKLIVVSLFLYTAYFYAPYVYEKIYDENILRLLFSSPVEPIITLSHLHSWLLFAAHFLGGVLLLSRVLYAKYIYLFSVLLSIFLSSLSGVLAYTGFDMLVLALLNMVDAIIIYLSFFGRE